MELLKLWKQRDKVSRIIFFAALFLIISLQSIPSIRDIGIGYFLLVYFVLIFGSHYIQRRYYTPKFKEAAKNIQKDLLTRTDVEFYIGLYQMHSYLCKNTRGPQKIQSEIAAFLSFRFASDKQYPRSEVIKNIAMNNNIADEPSIEAVYDYLAVYQVSKGNFDAYLSIRKELLNRIEEAIDDNKYDVTKLDAKIKKVACLRREIKVFEKQDKRLFEELQKPEPKTSVQSQVISMYIDIKIASYFEWDELIPAVKSQYPLPNSDSYLVEYIKNA